MFSSLSGPFGPTLGAPNTVVSGTAPTITTASLNPGTVGTVYPTTNFNATGTDPKNWSIVSGTLPTGMSFSLEGVLSGTPTATASGSITFRATNAYGLNDRALTLTINAASTTAPTITTISLPSGTVSSPYNGSGFQISATGTAPITWSIISGSISPLTLSSGGVISGTPSTATTLNATFRATNAYGTNDKALSILVNAAGTGPVSLTAPTIVIWRAA